MKISAAESRIMEIVWRADRPIAVEDVAQALDGEAGWTEGTVRTFMTRLKAKKALAVQKEGRRYFYRPLIERKDYLHAQSRGLIDRFFDGHIGTFVARFAEQEKLSDAELGELKALVERLSHDR